jgi:hypothetical protein
VLFVEETPFLQILGLSHQKLSSDLGKLGLLFSQA